MKHVNFVSKDVQRILSSHKSIINSKRSTRKLFIKISQYSQENTCDATSFLIKMHVFSPPALLKRDSNTGVFLWKFLRTSILKNISKRLFWRLSLDFESFTLLDVFSKIKQNKNRSKTQLYEKTCLFMMFFIISFFSFSPLHVRRHLPYIIKDDTSESFETA